MGCCEFAWRVIADSGPDRNRVYTPSVDRLNSEGIPRWQLRAALRSAPAVRHARKHDSCLLCCAPKVNEAGLCHVCWAMLDDVELRAGERWLSGEAP